MKSLDSANLPDILFCDNHLVIAMKPPGWLTQPDDSNRDDLESFVKEWVKKEFNKNGNVFLHCIHRLDRVASGLVLFAKTSKALTRLNEFSRANKIKRFYHAEVEGIIPKKSGHLEHYLIHGDHRAIVSNEKEGKKAQLTYQVEEIKEHTTTVQIELQTGRYHQIRAQFAFIGHPIVGDSRYNAKSGREDEIHLACTDLTFPHPITREDVSFRSDPFYL
jgi:23S rRNA pseudouridine1911/1915/1917 synthase